MTHLAVDVLELLDPVAEGSDLGGAHEGEIERVEEEHNVLACAASATKGPVLYNPQSTVQ